MTYSFTQISQYLRCPRQYRYRYLDGWREKEDKAAMMFGRCFENSLAAYFAREDSTAAFSREWSKYQDASLAYTKNDSWDRLYHQGIHLLERFAQDDRVRIRSSKREPSSEVDALTAIREPIPVLHRCDRRARWDEMHCRLENDDVSLSGSASGSLGAGSATDLLFLDDRDLRCRSSRLCAKERARNSVSEDIHC